MWNSNDFNFNNAKELNDMKNYVKKMLIKLGIVKKNVIKEFIKRGGNCGNNVVALDTTLDARFPWLISIGDNVTLIGVTVLAHDASTKRELGYTKIGKVSIGSKVFIGKGTIILPNIKIGNCVVIGAGSVVSKDIPDNCVAVGNPCRVIKPYDLYIKEQTERMKKCNVIIDKLPQDLNENEIKSICEQLNGVGYIR